jgi:beta-barrel assembly-enhancing protease
MSAIRTLAAGLLSTLILGAGFAFPSDDPRIDPPKRLPNPTKKRSSNGVPGGRNLPKNAGRQADEPPPCESRTVVRPARPPVRSMPDLFDRMAENLMKNPATAWQGMAQDLSHMEGPALEGVSLSIAEERRVGQKARTQYLETAQTKGYRVVDDAKRNEYLKDLVDVLAKRMRNRQRYPHLEVTLIDAPVSDGQSFPGGYVVFTTALLEEPDEATVAGVVAHELAHLDRGHLYEYAKRGKLAEATYSQRAGANNAFDQFFTRQMALFGLLMNPFRPEHETEADCTSVTWLYQEGYDPRALVGFFERVHSRNRDMPENPFFNFGRTHPFSLDRADAVRARLRQLQAWRPRNDLGLFAENLERREAKGRALRQAAAARPKAKESKKGT